MNDDFFNKLNEFVDLTVVNIELDRMNITLNADELEAVVNIKNSRKCSSKEAYDLFEKNKQYKKQFNELLDE